MKVLLIVLVILIILGSGGIGYKTFVLNQPKEGPKAIVSNIFDNINAGKPLENQKYMVSQTALKDIPTEASTTSYKLIGRTLDETITGNSAKVVEEVDLLLLKVNMEFKLQRTGDWIHGYTWKVSEINTPKLDQTLSNPLDSTPSVGVTPTETPTNWISKDINDEITLATIKFRITGSSESTSIKSNNMFAENITAKSGSKFVRIKYAVTNTTSSAMNINGGDIFKIRDDKNNLYNEFSEMYSLSVDNVLVYKSLNPNIPTHGEILFDIPDSVNHYEIVSCKKDSSDCYAVKLK